MKILFLSHRVPYPPNKGDKIRSFNILKYLNERHVVHVACPVDNDDDVGDVRDLVKQGYSVKAELIRPLSRLLNVARFGVAGEPLSVGHFWSRRLLLKIKTQVAEQKYDALFVFSSTMAEYAKELDIPVRIIDFCDLDSAKFEQFAGFASPPKSWLYNVEGKRLARYEKKLASQFDHLLFIGPEEKKLYAVNGSSAKVKIMSNGVEQENWDESSETVNPSTSPFLLFTGVMDYFPNADAVQWFVENVFHDLKSLFPAISFYIVGKNPIASVRKLHNPKKGVHVTGFVDDLKPYLAHASAFIAPVRIARGMQTKILEAMAHGIPVVSSRASIRGIDAEEEHNILPADEAYEYVKQISRLLSNEPLALRLQANALQFVKEKFNWEKNLGLLDELLDNKYSTA